MTRVKTLLLLFKQRILKLSYRVVPSQKKTGATDVFNVLCFPNFHMSQLISTSLSDSKAMKTLCHSRLYFFGWAYSFQKNNMPHITDKYSQICTKSRLQPFLTNSYDVIQFRHLWMCCRSQHILSSTCLMHLSLLYVCLPSALAVKHTDKQDAVKTLTVTSHMALIGRLAVMSTHAKNSPVVVSGQFFGASLGFSGSRESSM